MAMATRLVKAVAPVTDTSTAWAQMYQALAAKLGLSPTTFQLIVPFTTWNWTVANSGQTSADQQSFLDAMPVWSPIGAYTSGSSFADAYQTWLNTLVVQADNVLQNQITIQQGVLQTAINKYIADYKAAQAAYQGDPSVTNNAPVFSVWLQSGLGLGYAATLQTDQTNVQSQQQQLNRFIAQANDPVVAAAQAAMSNPAYLTQVVSSSISNAIAEPGYTQMTSFSTWITQNAGTGSTTVNWSTSDRNASFSNTFAAAASTISFGFFELFVEGSWQRCAEMDANSAMSVSITFNPWGRQAITPLPWYSEATVKAKANNPAAYRQGYTSTQPPNGQGGWIFGPGGIMPLRTTDMLVAYQPSFNITSSTSFSSAMQSQLKVATGIRIGPFVFGGEYSQSTNTWQSSSTANSFTGSSTSQFPVIFGVLLEVFGQS